MKMRVLLLLDEQRNELAVARVLDEGERFRGTIDLSSTPPHIRELFDEFEEIVDGQMFSLLDEIQQKIDSLGLRAKFDSCNEARISDLQVYPRTGDVSFRLAESAVRS
ncbi:MAG TPA: hypothetical protein VML55_25855 [Planctomycetaceae bacterium]|nr:hypothetical protein [Planctomycetaceae bacterium]